jgi:CxxC-x17-CxxC domain-containing protein
MPKEGAMLNYVDKVLVCRDCGREFVFSAGEQEFYQSRGLQHEPRRCPDCRNARRQQDGASRPGRVMHDVICSNCGKLTQVPFVPTGSRPVYCQDCFQTARR